jgi:hypothetical protein
MVLLTQTIVPLLPGLPVRELPAIMTGTLQKGKSGIPFDDTVLEHSIGNTAHPKPMLIVHSYGLVNKPHSDCFM